MSRSGWLLHPWRIPDSIDRVLQGTPGKATRPPAVHFLHLPAGRNCLLHQEDVPRLDGRGLCHDNGASLLSQAAKSHSAKAAGDVEWRCTQMMMVQSGAVDGGFYDFRYLKASKRYFSADLDSIFCGGLGFFTWQFSWLLLADLRSLDILCFSTA